MQATQLPLAVGGRSSLRTARDVYVLAMPTGRQPDVFARLWCNAEEGFGLGEDRSGIVDGVAAEGAVGGHHLYFDQAMSRAGGVRRFNMG